MGFFIGVNGCSLKTAENVAAAKSLPLDRILLETDAPWCSVTTSHASHAHLPKDLVVVEKVKPEKHVPGKGVKGRNEPAEVSELAFPKLTVRSWRLRTSLPAFVASPLRSLLPPLGIIPCACYTRTRSKPHKWYTELGLYLPSGLREIATAIRRTVV